MGIKKTGTAITPVTVLKQVLELDRYVSTLDVHRMDKEGLYDYISGLLPGDTIQKLNAFNDLSINKSIVEVILKSSHVLSFKYAKPLAERLTTINSDAITIERINKFVDHSRNADS